MSRTLRYLRISFSATCLIACVLLIALWVRSYWWVDELHVRLWGNQTLLFGSKKAFVAGIMFECGSWPFDWQSEIQFAKADDEEQSFHLNESQTVIKSLRIRWYDHPEYESGHKTGFLG